MTYNKETNWKKYEKIGLSLILLFILVNAIINRDSVAALISAICGITYTFLAGKGLPKCYLFGVTGSSFYCWLSFQSALWGNLLLYAAYYIPMQIIGYFRWNKNLKEDKKEIVKISLSKKELLLLVLIMSVISVFVYYLLLYFKDTHPILDIITTVFSIGGMYLTVRRAIQQWIFWMLVNTLSLFMWINVIATGTKAYSTVIMWAVYLCLAIYFYLEWRKEIKQQS
jgi:nicotinamide mononucleotide transporter